jgi:hypothetical protein
MSALTPYTTAGDPLVPADRRGWRTRIVAATRRGLRPLLRIHLLALGVVALLAAVVLALLTAQVLAVPEEGPGPYDSTLAAVVVLVGVLGALAAVTLAQGAAAYVVVAQAADEPAPVRAALCFARGRARGLLGWGLAAQLLLGTFVALAVVVSAWFWIPVAYLAVVFSAGLVGVVVVERRGLGRCVVLVHRRLLATTGRMLVLFLVLFVVVVLVGLLGGVVIRSLPYEFAPVVFMVELMLFVLLGVVTAPGAVVSYAELRAREDPDVRTPDLVAELHGEPTDVPDVAG